MDSVDEKLRIASGDLEETSSKYEGIKEEYERIEQEIEDMIAARQAARKEKNFKLADEIRDTLLQKGIILEDTREGVKWKRA